MKRNIDTVRDVPGIRLNLMELQTICCRYYIAGQYTAGKKVLEVGCGVGLGLGYLLKKAKSVVGGDISEEALATARKHYQKRVELIRLDAQKLSFRDSSFDTVVAMEILYYLPHPEEFIDECRRVLVDGGTLVLCVGNKDYPAPTSKYYNMSAPELFSLLSKRFETELFGAFPRQETHTKIKRRSELRIIAGNIIRVFPGGEGLVNLLGNFANNRNLRLPEELEEKDMTAEDFKLTPIPDNSHDNRHRFLYAIAHTYKASSDNQSNERTSN